MRYSGFPLLATLILALAPAVLLVQAPAWADEAPPTMSSGSRPAPPSTPEDPTKDWPVHFEPSPPRPPPAVPDVRSQAAGAADAKAGGISGDDLWAANVRRRHREGALGFAGTYGAAVLAGAGLTGLILLHDSKNHEDSTGYLYAVSFPLFVPVAGPIYLGGLVAVVYTASLFTATGPYVALAITMAPAAYGFSLVAIADGVMQAVFLGQALGWSDPARPSQGARSSIARTILGVTPLLVPEVAAPAWIGASHAQGLPSAVGVQLPGMW